MAAYSYHPTVKLIPTREEVAIMLKSPAVLVTLIVAATVLGLGLVGTVGWLIYEDKSVTELLSLVSLIISAATYYKAKTIERNTNGTQSRLMDHALGPAPKVE